MFNIKVNHCRYDTDILDLNDFNLDNINIEDIVKLFKGNLYPLEYYIRFI